MKNTDKKKDEITESKINYVEQMATEMINALKDFYNDNVFGDYIYASKSRAKFDRLRIELNKELLNIKKIIYKEK